MAGKWDESKRKRDKFGRFVSGSGGGSGKSDAARQIAWRNKSRRFIGDSLKRSSVWKNGQRIFSDQKVVNDRSDRVSIKSNQTFKNGRKVSGKRNMSVKANETKRSSSGKVVYKNGKRVKDTRKKK